MMTRSSPSGSSALVCLLGLIAVRVPIAYTMILVGIVGTIVQSGPPILLNQLKDLAYAQFANYDLSVLPMFILMGGLAARCGLSRDLFRAANAWLGRFRGGVAMAAVAACAGFGARLRLLDGHRLHHGPGGAAGAAPLQVLPGARHRHHRRRRHARHPHPALRGAHRLRHHRRGQHRHDVRRGAHPGHPGGAPVHDRPSRSTCASCRAPGRKASPVPRAELVAATLAVIPVLVIFGVVIGGIYAGIYNPTPPPRSASSWSASTASRRGACRCAASIDALLETARTTGMIFLILLGAELLKIFMARAGVPQAAADFLQNSGLPPLGILVLIIVIFLIFGCLMDSLSMVILAIPFFWPVVAGLDFGLGPDEPEDLVRHHHPHRRRTGTDHSARRAQRLHHQFARARRADARDLQGRHALLRVGDRPRHAARRLPVDHAVPAAPAALSVKAGGRAVQAFDQPLHPRRRRCARPLGAQQFHQMPHQHSARVQRRQRVIARWKLAHRNRRHPGKPLAVRTEMAGNLPEAQIALRCHHQHLGAAGDEIGHPALHLAAPGHVDMGTGRRGPI